MSTAGEARRSRRTTAVDGAATRNGPDRAARAGPDRADPGPDRAAPAPAGAARDRAGPAPDRGGPPPTTTGRPRPPRDPPAARTSCVTRCADPCLTGMRHRTIRIL